MNENLTPRPPLPRRERGRLAIAFAIAFAGSLAVAPEAFAQIPNAAEPTTAPPDRHPDQKSGPTQHPPAENAAAEKEANAHGEGDHGGEGEAAEHEGHEHHLAPINFADFDRYGKEKEDAAKGGEAPTIPFVYILANALILYAIYYYAGKKPISDGLGARRATVAKELDEAAKIKAEAKAKLDEYSSRLDKLDHELEAMKRELVAAGEKDRDRIVKEAEEKAERMRKDAQFLVAQEMKQLRLDLLRHTAESATSSAEQVLKGKLTAQDHERLADEFLGQLSTLPAAGARGEHRAGGRS